MKKRIFGITLSMLLLFSLTFVAISFSPSKAKAEGEQDWRKYTLDNPVDPCNDPGTSCGIRLPELVIEGNC